jgi:hypothetical protein
MILFFFGEKDKPLHAHFSLEVGHAIYQIILLLSNVDECFSRKILGIEMFLWFINI